MQTVQLNIQLDISRDILDKVMFLLENLPKNKVKLKIKDDFSSLSTDSFDVDNSRQSEVNAFQELSNISLEKIWDNKEDEVYDRFLK
jgi:hypothetical protein